jgi:hypothetical protein
MCRLPNLIKFRTRADGTAECGCYLVLAHVEKAAKKVIDEHEKLHLDQVCKARCETKGVGSFCTGRYYEKFGFFSLPKLPDRMFLPIKVSRRREPDPLKPSSAAGYFGKMRSRTRQAAVWFSQRLRFLMS